MAPNYEILDIDVHENRIRGPNMYEKSVETNLETLVQTETFPLHHLLSLMRQQINEN